MPLIETRGLTKLYRMGDAVVRALDGVDLRIERGEFVAITGPSGSGKSTMMHLLGCLDRPTAGAYFLDGRDVSRLSDSDLAIVRNKFIGFVFQTFNLINRITAWENVAVPLFYARKTNARGPSLRALERVGLAPRATHQPNELSGGERQRVAMARALVNDPVLLMADEPTGNLDTRTGEQIMQIVRSLNEQGVTIIMVTHEWDIAVQARRIVQMRDGKIIADRQAADVRPEEWSGGAGAATRGPSPAPAPAAPPTAVVAGAPAAPAEAPATVADTSAVACAPQPIPRMMRGAKPALVCGLVAASLLGFTYATQLALQLIYPEEVKRLSQLQPGQVPKMPPVPMMVAGLVNAAASLGSIVMAIIAIVFGAGARKRMRQEIGTWLGKRHALIGMLLGWAVIGVVVLSMAISVYGSVSKMRGG